MFEGYDFVLDTLGPGSVINQRAFFLKDQMYVNMRAKSEVKLMFYSLAKLKEHITKYANAGNFATRVLIAQNKYIKGTKGGDKYPVDYIYPTPHGGEEELERLARIRRLKSVVMRIVLQIRERKQRPNLFEVMKVYKKKLREHESYAYGNMDVREIKRQF